MTINDLWRYDIPRYDKTRTTDGSGSSAVPKDVAVAYESLWPPKRNLTWVYVLEVLFLNAKPPNAPLVNDR
jgi:hypothetical protein